MSKDTPFKAMTPPNTTLTSRTASKGYRRCASCSCIMSFRPNDRPGRNDHAKLFAGYNDEGYLIPSTARLNFPPVFNFAFCFLDWGAQLPCSSSRQSSPSQMPDRVSQPSLQHYRVREQEPSFPDVTS
jgi:hypothetical protein